MLYVCRSCPIGQKHQNSVLQYPDEGGGEQDPDSSLAQTSQYLKILQEVERARQSKEAEAAADNMAGNGIIGNMRKG